MESRGGESIKRKSIKQGSLSSKSSNGKSLPKIGRGPEFLVVTVWKRVFSTK